MDLDERLSEACLGVLAASFPDGSSAASYHVIKKHPTPKSKKPGLLSDSGGYWLRYV